MEAVKDNILTRYADAMLAGGVIGILVVMIIPMPTIILDLLLSLSVAMGITIVLVAMYMREPLDFSSFPSVLLIITLFRLALNVASTRLILLHGHEGTSSAGHVIEAFGNFVVGGNYVIGTVIFVILIVINFVVITKGSVRTSEVAARFTLDAIPGKQMAIDADLNAGLINEQEARKRRVRLQKEADFYGAMDGAIRFVRGDAVAGIIITITNVLGGFAIGVLMRDMPLSEALKNYTLLTIGDGLVTQLPALVVSTAAGIVVTRASADTDLGTQISSQILVYPRVSAITSGILFMMSVVPGMPHTAFFLLGALSAGIAYISYQTQTEAKAEAKQKAEDTAKAPVEEKVESLLALDPIELEIGYELIPLVDASQNGELLERIKSIRRQFAMEKGFIVPPIHIRDNLQLKPNEYNVLLKGSVIARGELNMNHYLAINPGGDIEPVPGIATVEPTFGLPALWVSEANRDRAKAAGYTVVDTATMITTHLKELLKRHAHELLGRQEAQKLIDTVKETSPKVVEELVPATLTLGQTQKVLQNLLREDVSIRDMLSILETLADYGTITKNTDVLTEYARQSLARHITKQYLTADAHLPVMTLDPEIENMIAQSVKQTEFGSYITLDPERVQMVIGRIQQMADRFAALNYQPVMLVSPAVRMHVKRMTDRSIPNMAVLSHNEISNEATVENIGVVGLR